MGTLNPLGWGSMLKDGKTYYTCGPESTPSVPKIKCDLLPGWEHKLSMSTGKRYYLCRAGNNGNGFSQWSAPTEPCTKNSVKKETRANASKGIAPPPSTGDPAVGTGGQTLTPPTTPTIATPPQTPRPSGLNISNATTAAQKAATTTAASTNAAVGAAVSKLAANADTIHVIVKTKTGSEGFSVKPTGQTGGRNRYNKTRRNKNRNNRKNKSKRNRNRNNRK